MRVKDILHAETGNTTISAFIVAVSFGVSALLGIIRDRLLAGRFGADNNLDIYFTAFRIPDFIYGLVIVGGLTSAFLPVLSEYLKKGDDEEGRSVAVWPEEGQLMVSNVLTAFSLILLFFCGLLFILTPMIIGLIAPGFSADQVSIAIDLTRIMFLSPLLLGISNIISGVLQYSNRFLSYSLAPLFYNLGIIIGILFFVPVFGLTGLAWGVVFGAILHLSIQLPAFLSSGFRFRMVLDFGHSSLLKIFKMMAPRIIGQASYHFNLIFITAIASTLVSGSIAIFNFSNNLQWFPVGMIGVSFAVATFPDLSRHFAKNRYEEFIKSMFFSLRRIVFLIVPVSIIMILLRAQIVRLVLGTGRFGWTETRLTAASLGVFAFGLLATSIIPLIIRAFFSLKDTRTPVIASICSTVINLLLSISLIKMFSVGIGDLISGNKFVSFTATLLRIDGLEHIEVIALPIALLISGIFQALFLWVLLSIKIKKISDPASAIWQNNVGLLKIYLSKVFVSATAMFAVTYLFLNIAGGIVDMRTYGGVLLQAFVGGLLGVMTYIIVAYLLRLEELTALKGLITIKKNKYDR